MATNRRRSDSPTTLRTSQGAEVGASVAELVTPTVLVDVEALTRNIATMAAHVGEMPAGLRPHAKVHKVPEIARLQLEAGAVGITVATAGEAAMMVEAGIPDVLIANEVTSAAALDKLLATIGTATVTLAVDSLEGLKLLESAAARACVMIDVVVEVDIGMGKCGVRSPKAALDLARRVASKRALRLRGVIGWEGHCADEPDRRKRSARTCTAIDKLAHAAELIDGDDLSVEVVSAGGTGTYDITGRDSRITDIQAGSYVFMDTYHEVFCDTFEPSLMILATVLSRHGNRVVLDAGRKALDSAFPAPRVAGRVWTLEFLHEEHAGFRTQGEQIHVGEQVEIVPGYAPTVANLYSGYHVVSDGRVVDIWQMQARHGPSP